MLRALDLGGGERSLDRKPELRSPSTAPSLRGNSVERERSAERRDTGTSVVFLRAKTTLTGRRHRPGLDLVLEEYKRLLFVSPLSLVELRVVVNSKNSERIMTSLFLI